MTKILFHQYQPLHAEEVGTLFEAAFGQTFSAPYWTWRFLHNPNVDAAQIAYIKDKGEVVAYYAVSPVHIIIDGKPYMAALSNMTMTHPEHQGKGYFRLLANALYDHLQEQDYIGVFGFANQNSHYGFRKYLNWVDLSSLCNFVLTPATFRKPKVVQTTSMTFKQQPLESKILQHLSNMFCSNAQVIPSRDYNNLKWRLVDIPTKNYFTAEVTYEEQQLVIIFKTFEGSLDIMEVFYTDSKAAKNPNLLHYAVDQLLREAKGGLNIWSNLYSDEHLLLEKIGFKNTSFSTYFGVIPFRQAPNELLNISNWHFRFYDSDVY